MKVQNYKVLESNLTGIRKVVPVSEEYSEELFCEVPPSRYYSDDYVGVATQVLSNVASVQGLSVMRLVALLRKAGVEGSKIYDVARLYQETA